MALLSTAQVANILCFVGIQKLMPMQISKLLALATVIARRIKVLKNATFLFSIQNYINVITIRCPFQDTQSAI